MAFCESITTEWAATAHRGRVHFHSKSCLHIRRARNILFYRCQLVWVLMGIHQRNAYVSLSDGVFQDGIVGVALVAQDKPECMAYSILFGLQILTMESVRL